VETFVLDDVPGGGREAFAGDGHELLAGFVEHPGGAFHAAGGEVIVLLSVEVERELLADGAAEVFGAIEVGFDHAGHTQVGLADHLRGEVGVDDVVLGFIGGETALAGDFGGGVRERGKEDDAEEEQLIHWLVDFTMRGCG
jgi:hypothetical protein